MVKDAVEKLGGALVPPDFKKLNPNLVWALIMSGTLFATAVTLGVHLWWSATNFAMAADVNDVARLQLEEKLDDVYTIICTRDAVDPAIAERARTLQRLYREVNGGEPYEYDCDLLEKLRTANAAPG